MSAMLKPIAFLLIIFAAYLVKRAGLFRPRDYRVMQVVVFDFTLPASIIVSFATNPHHPNMLLISGFAFLCALLPLPLTFLASRRKPAADRAFLMLNASGFNVGNFCFPVLQAFMGPSALVTASMFDIGNSVMVTAGTNVMTTSMLHIDMDKPITEQHAGNAPTLPYTRPKDRDARRLARRAKLRKIAKGFLTSVPFDIYMLMLVVMFCRIPIPAFIPTLLEPVANANSFCSVFMVGMLMDLPQTGKDVRDVLRVLAWRLPLGIAFSALAWFVLPFDAGVRKAVVMLTLAPTAVFSTLFTDRVLGNAKLAGFTLAASAIVAILLMTGVQFLLPS
ncbi:AEC family transporter [Bifidobacterium amazonense]|uniref:AEC family transporter n=1 Tax=Bifidobacterium amazonense TaxID=2809027 RepID=A0ABS9VUB6_9BIFI|nr:AEC family transporter [Bifidobacterium amazonense]MCH9275405.1 AEC family transporter [Bifidobacterium amazonense]